MTSKILIRDYHPDDAQALANIYFHTIHRINSAHYTQNQVDIWAPESSLKTKNWTKRFLRTNSIIASIDNVIVGFVEFETNGHIDCFYCHHKWIGKGVGSALMDEILRRAKSLKITRIFTEASITAKRFFEKKGFQNISEQKIVKKGVEFINYKMEKNLQS